MTGVSSALVLDRETSVKPSNGMFSSRAREVMADLKFLSSRMKGWERVWNLIKDKYGDIACYQEGEAWQYMGTSGRHEFRHRNLKGNRLYDSFPIQPGDFDLIQSKSRECACGISRADCTYHKE